MGSTKILQRFFEYSTFFNMGFKVCLVSQKSKKIKSTPKNKSHFFADVYAPKLKGMPLNCHLIDVLLENRRLLIQFQSIIPKKIRTSFSQNRRIKM